MRRPNFMRDCARWFTISKSFNYQKSKNNMLKFTHILTGLATTAVLLCAGISQPQFGAAEAGPRAGGIKPSFNRAAGQGRYRPAFNKAAKNTARPAFLPLERQQGKVDCARPSTRLPKTRQSRLSTRRPGGVSFVPNSTTRPRIPYAPSSTKLHAVRSSRSSTALRGVQTTTITMITTSSCFHHRGRNSRLRASNGTHN